MEINEFFNQTNGRESDGTPKATIVMILSLFNKETQDMDNKEVLREYSSLTAAAEIYPSPSLTEIDIHCFSHLDADLVEFWEIVKKYFELGRGVTPEDTIIPLLEVVIYPTKLQGQVFISAINPCFHAITADNLKDKNHIIALAFNQDNLFKVEPEHFDASEFIANAEREAAQRIAMLEQDEIERMKKMED